MKMELSNEDLLDWYKVSLNRLIAVCKESSAKYTRSKLRKSFPPDFAYILEELLSENNRVVQKEQYYNEILIPSSALTGRRNLSWPFHRPFSVWLSPDSM